MKRHEAPLLLMTVTPLPPIQLQSLCGLPALQPLAVRDSDTVLSASPSCTML